MTAAGRHFLHVFSTFDAGGPQVRTAQLLGRLGAGHRHTIVAMDGRTGCAERLPAGVAVEFEPAPGRRGPLRVSAWAAALLRRRRPDLLLTYNWGAIEVLGGAWRAGFRRVVHHEEGFGDEEIERLLPRRNLMRRLLLPRARAVLVPSRTLLRIAREVWRQPAARVVYLPNGVDLERFRAPPRAAGERVVIGSVSAFRPLKNQRLLIRAFARLRGRAAARLVLVGDGPEQAACRQLVASLGVGAEVEFAGTAADTSRCYPGFDVFALSSRTEQMPIVLLEAMAAGLPVAATDVGDVREMLAPPNRDLVVARDDEAALAAALDRLVADSAERRRLGAANRRRCEEAFEVGACHGRYLAWFEAVAGGGVGPPSA